jgi:hypothetical protein
MVIPSTGYLFENKRQTLLRSDWPSFSAISAQASPHVFGPSGLPVVRSWLQGNDIPLDRQEYWLQAHAGAKTNCDGVTGTLYVPEVYQFYAANAMSSAGGVLAMGCGTGKTLTAELYALAVAPKLCGKPCIIATTLTAFRAWKPYLDRFKAMGYGSVHLISIDSLHKFEPAFPSAGGLLILDESHLLGSVTARRTKHAMRLRLKVDDALCLSGTMFHGGIPRALTNMNLAVPGLAGFSSAYNAAQHFGCLQQLMIPGVGRVTKILKPEGQHFDAFKSFVTRRFVCALTKNSPLVASCVTIPEQDQETVEFGGPWMDVHTACVHEVRRAIEANEGIPHAMKVMQALAHQGIETKAQYILDMLSDGEPLVVFCQYHESLNYLENLFKEEGISYARIDGSTSVDERGSIESAFSRGELRVILGQCVAAGVSISLTRSHRSVSTDISWRPEDYDQMLARTCRRGQAHRCRHTDLVANRFQSEILQRIRSGMVFDASVSAFQDARRATGL